MRRRTRRDRIGSPLFNYGSRRPRRRRRWLLLALPLLAALIAFFAVGFERSAEDPSERDGEVGVSGTAAASGAQGRSRPKPKGAGSKRKPRAGAEAASVGKQFKLRPAAEQLPIDRELKKPPRAGLLFDIDSGEVLWERHPGRELPIASLTKMMTALLIAGDHKSGEQVLVSKRAVRTTGSKVGLLPEGKRVDLEALLYGLLLVSGNDTAVALAEHDAGSVEKFVAKMNEEARRRGLDCTRFSSPHGLADSGNFSCPRDLAAMARAILADKRLAKIAGTQDASFDFPIKGGKLDLYNNNPLMRLGRPGITGVKTGLTEAAGRCYVTTAVRGGRHLGVVLLHSPDPITQIDKLLDDGVKAERAN